MKIIIATKNSGKVEEFRELFSSFDIQFLSLLDIDYQEEIEETGSSFYENAYIKAKQIYDIYKIPTLADDSGLCVDALGGEPGIYSARYKGLDSPKKRRRRILEMMEGIQNRKAHFYCSLVFIDENGKDMEFNGQVDGFIGYEELGDKGFGYDPIFMIDDNTSFAMLEMDEKNKISHRGLAIEKFKEYLNGLSH